MYITDELGIKAIKSDSALYTWMKNGTLSCVMGTFVDDNLNAGNEDFPMYTEHTFKKFESKHCM